MTEKPETTAVAKAEPTTIKGWLTTDKIRNQITKALPRHLSPDRFIRIALTALTKTPKLVACTQESFFQCLLDLSQLGIEPDGRRAHLIPYGNKCTLIIDYKGLVELAMRSGQVANIHADIVCENDAFTYDRGEVTTHKIDFRNPRGEMFAAYAICTFKDGTKSSVAMSKEEVDAIRKRSKAGGSGPWVTDYNEMAKKTAFRRLSKWLPLSPEYRDAIEYEDDIVDVDARSVTVEPPDSLDAVADTIAAKNAAAETVDEETGEVTEPTNPAAEGAEAARADAKARAKAKDPEPEPDEAQTELPCSDAPDKDALRAKLDLIMDRLKIGTAAVIRATGKPLGLLSEDELQHVIQQIERGEIKGK